jgi:hypothetical protein
VEKAVKGNIGQVGPVYPLISKILERSTAEQKGISRAGSV